jgi:hypothetical protein
MLAKTSSKFLQLKLITPEDGNCNVSPSVQKLSPFYTGYMKAKSYIF